MRRCALSLPWVAGAWGFAGAAHAGDGNVPPPAPTLSADVCLLEVDRSRSPAVSLPYGLTLEEPPDMADLLPDARTHQFLGLCRDLPPAPGLPLWVHLDDAERAQMAGILGAIPPDNQIVELSPDWQGGHDGAAGTCLQLIDTAAQRRPITCAAAADDVSWDTTGVPAGTYVIHVHGFDPLPNGWARRPGIVRIHDGDPAAAPPGASLLSPALDNMVVFGDAGFELLGCAAGAPGTTVTVEWARVVVPDAWTTIDTVDVDPDACGFAVHWTPPDPPPLGEVMFRAVATDPMDRSFIGYAPGTVGVLAGAGPGDPAEPPPFNDPACDGPGERAPSLTICGATGTGGDTGDTGGDTGGADESTSGPVTSSSSSSAGSSADPTDSATSGPGTDTSSSDGDQTTNPTSGCACRSDTAVSASPLLVLALLQRRRRR